MCKLFKTQKCQKQYPLINRRYIQKINGDIDGFNYRYSLDYKKEMAAFQEGARWMSIGFMIEEQNFLNRESYVLLVFAQELFIKSLLLKSGKEIRGHYIYKLFEKLGSSTKMNIIQNVELSELSVINTNGEIVDVLISFDDYLKYESNYFVDLRYEYEKIDINDVTTIPRHFINNLTVELYKECYAHLSEFLENL